MKRDDIQIFENNILRIIQKLSIEYSALFEKVGLTFKVNNVRILKIQEVIYESEISIDFYDQYGICDVVEFHIYDNGNPVAPLNEIESWLRESYNGVLQKKEEEKKGAGDRPQKGTEQ